MDTTDIQKIRILYKVFIKKLFTFQVELRPVCIGIYKKNKSTFINFIVNMLSLLGKF